MDSYSRYANEWTRDMRSGQVFSRSFIEKPAMRAKLPDLREKKVLCVGSGSGDECRELADLGATVLGIDRSPELISIARANFPEIEFRQMDMEELELPKASFDFVYASLVLHYTNHWTEVLKGISNVMKPGGSCLFSVNHPVAWAAETVDEGDRKARLLGYEQDGAEIILRGDYLATRLLRDTWFGYFDVSFYTRPISRVFRDIREAGFQVIDFLEPPAVAEGVIVDPQRHARYQKIPLFMIFELRKPF